jgi:hypothetical protein
LVPPYPESQPLNLSSHYDGFIGEYHYGFGTVGPNTKGNLRDENILLDDSEDTPPI